MAAAVLVRQAGQLVMVAAAAVVMVCICLVVDLATEGATRVEGGVGAGGGSLTPCKQHTERQERDGRQARGAVFHQRWGSRSWSCWRPIKGEQAVLPLRVSRGWW